MAIPCERVVLIVDDDEMIRDSVADLLSEEGYAVITAENGADALAKLRRTPPPHPCLILLDLMMPVMNGQQFYEQKQLDPELVSIPVVIISAERNLRQRAIPFGGEYLEKPVRAETILTTLARLCGGVIQSPRTDVRAERHVYNVEKGLPGC